MSPRTPKQFEAIREEKRSIILDAALELFGKEGYHNTSVSKIAKRAGISKGLVYNYFDSKEAVVKELLHAGIDQMLYYIDIQNDLDPQQVEYVINKTFEHVEQNREFWKLYFSISLQPEIFPLIREKINELAQPLFRMGVDYLTRAGYENPQGETMIFAALMDGICFHYIMDPDHYPLDLVRQTLLQRYVQPFKEGSG